MMEQFKYISNINEICSNLNLIENETICMRLIKSDKPNNDDFIPLYYLNKKFKKELECQAKGISLFEEIDDIIKMFELIPNISKRYNSIYKANISQKHGKLYKTPSKTKPSHRTFYTYKNCDEVKLFNEKVEI